MGDYYGDCENCTTWTNNTDCQNCTNWINNTQTTHTVERITTTGSLYDITDLSTSTKSAEVSHHNDDSQIGLVVSIVMQLIAMPPCIIGNLMVLLALFKYSKLRRSQSNLYILSLTIADFLVGVLLIPFETAMNIQQLQRNRSENDIGFCVMHRFLVAFTLGSSLASMLMISVDRYIAIIKPFFYAEKVTPRVIKLSIAVTWSVMLILCSPIFTSVMTEPHHPTRHCGFPCPSGLRTQGRVYTLIVYAILMLIFIGNIVLYSWVAKTALKQHMRIVKEMSKSNVQYRYRKGELKNTKIMVIMFGVFIMFWLPYMIVLTLYVSGVCPKDKRCPDMRDTALALGILNSGLNCYVYAWQKKDFKLAIKQILLSIRKRNRVCSIQPNKPLRKENRNFSKASLFTISSKLTTKPTELTMIATCHSSGIELDDVSRTLDYEEGVILPQPPQSTEV